MKSKGILALLMAAMMVLAMVPAVAEETLSPLTVSVAFVDSGMWDTDPEHSYFGKLVKEKFNLTVDAIALTWGDWKEKTSMWAASGQLPDYCLTFTDYFIWRDQGVSLGFPLETLDQYPNLKDRVPENVLPYLLDEDGLLYGVPRSSWRNSSQPTQATGLYVNKSFLEKAGLDAPPTTMDGWFDFLKKCVDGDFSGKGTIGISADAGVAIPLMTQLPYLRVGSSSWVKDGDEWTLGMLLDDNIAFLENARAWYQAGIIDKDIATRKSGDVANLFNEGRVAVSDRNADCDMMLQLPGPDKLLASDWLVLEYGPESPVDGLRHHYNLSNYDGVMAFNADIDPEKMERILMVQDWACSPEGEEVVTLGEEGVNFAIHADGTYENLCKTSDGVLQAYWIHEPFAMFGRFCPTWNFEYAITSPLHPAGNLKMAQDYFAAVREQATIAPANWGIEYYSSDARNNMPSITADYTAMYLNAITGTGDIPTLFETFREDALVKVGEAIADTNAHAKEMGW